MTNKLDQLFKKKDSKVLSIYFTAGYPELEDTKKILKAISDAGADFVEVGMPYSDPLADGPTIQASSEKALSNGISIKKIFEQLEDLRSYTEIPIVMMGYINPVIQYGVEEFCAKCKEIGVNGLILPDLPMQLYLDEYKAIFEKYELHNIFLITPQSSDERIKWIDENSGGFIYMVSSYSITGGKLGFSDQQIEYFNRVNSLGLKNPRIVGFGIHDKTSFENTCEYATGAIIGSAFIKAITDVEDTEKAAGEFVRSIID